MRATTRKWAAAIVTFVVLSLFVSQVPLFQAVTIRSGINQAMLYSFPVTEGDTFSIRYIHSIHRTPVTETYKIENGTITLDKMEFDTYGVGISSDLQPGETFSEKDGKFIIGNMHRKLPYFDQRIGQVIANHALLLREQELPLATISPPGSWVRFQAEKVTLCTRFGRGISHWINKIKQPT